MAEILSVRNLKKTFKLSAKQQKLEKSTSGLKTAVFHSMHMRVKYSGFSDRTARERPQRFV